MEQGDLEGNNRRDGEGMSITKFFVSNLPEGCTPQELRCCLEGFRKISGMYVAKKGIKEGAVKMGDYKLKVNIARFALENSGSADHPEENSNRFNVSGLGNRSNMFNFRDSRSYSDVLGKAKVSGDVSKDKGGYQVAEKSIIDKVLAVPDRTIAFKEMFRLAVVGRTVDLETLVDFDRLLRIARTTYSKIQYLGG
ncbi:putative RNA-binding domain superfamily [Helianthus anomalus]